MCVQCSTDMQWQHGPCHIQTPPTLVRDPIIPRSAGDDLNQPLTPKLSSDPWRRGQEVSLPKSLVAEFEAFSLISQSTCVYVRARTCAHTLSAHCPMGYLRGTEKLGGGLGVFPGPAVRVSSQPGSPRLAQVCETPEGIYFCCF